MEVDREARVNDRGLKDACEASGRDLDREYVSLLWRIGPAPSCSSLGCIVPPSDTRLSGRCLDSRFIPEV